MLGPILSVILLKPNLNFIAVWIAHICEWKARRKLSTPYPTTGTLDLRDGHLATTVAPRGFPKVLDPAAKYRAVGSLRCSKLHGVVGKTMNIGVPIPLRYRFFAAWWKIEHSVFEHARSPNNGSEAIVVRPGLAQQHGLLARRCDGQEHN